MGKRLWTERAARRWCAEYWAEVMFHKDGDCTVTVEYDEPRKPWGHLEHEITHTGGSFVDAVNMAKAELDELLAGIHVREAAWNALTPEEQERREVAAIQANRQRLECASMAIGMPISQPELRQARQVRELRESKERLAKIAGPLRLVDGS